MSIFGWKGDYHNLSKGAFDSISITKPGNASLLLHEHMTESFEDAYKKLTKDFKKVVSSNEIQGKTFWAEHIKPGLKKIGGMAWEYARPIVFESLAWMTGMGLPATLIIGAAETMMSEYLENLPRNFGSSPGKNIGETEQGPMDLHREGSIPPAPTTTER